LEFDESVWNGVLVLMKRTSEQIRWDEWAMDMNHDEHLDCYNAWRILSPIEYWVIRSRYWDGDIQRLTLSL
jgi:hypothetical protein